MSSRNTAADSGLAGRSRSRECFPSFLRYFPLLAGAAPIVKKHLLRSSPGCCCLSKHFYSGGGLRAAYEYARRRQKFTLNFETGGEQLCAFISCSHARCARPEGKDGENPRALPRKNNTLTPRKTIRPSAAASSPRATRHACIRCCLPSKTCVDGLSSRLQPLSL